MGAGKSIVGLNIVIETGGRPAGGAVAFGAVRTK